MTTTAMIATIATLAKRLLQQSLAQARLINFIEAERLVEEEISSTGISDSQRKILHDAANAEEVYAIDAQWMLSKLEVCSGRDSDKIVRTLVRAGIIPEKRSRDFTLDADHSVGQIHHATGPISLDQTEVLFVNADCVELQLKVVSTNGKTQHLRRYMLTANALNCVLMGPGNNNVFAKYFSRQLILVSQYREYTMRYNQILSERENKHLKENYDRVLVKMDAQSAQLAEVLAVNQAQSAKLDEQSDQLTELLSVNREQTGMIREILEVLKNISMAWSPQMILRMQFQQHVQNIAERFGYDESLTDKQKRMCNSTAFLLMKTMFLVPIYSTTENTLTIYYCCRNIRQIILRLKELAGRMRDGEIMLEPIVVGMVNVEVNAEMSNIRNINIDGFASKFLRRNKALKVFDIDEDDVPTVLQWMTTAILKMHLTQEQALLNGCTMEPDVQSLTTDVIGTIGGMIDDYHATVRQHLVPFFHWMMEEKPGVAGWCPRSDIEPKDLIRHDQSQHLLDLILDDSLTTNLGGKVGAVAKVRK